MNEQPTRYLRRDLRIVDNNTRDWDGGYTVEYRDSILAGPYACIEDAREAKQDLIAGRAARAHR